jgi:hypothetical protein
MYHDFFAQCVKVCNDKFSELRISLEVAGQFVLVQLIGKWDRTGGFE